MKLTHLGISQFRSIGSEPVMIDLTKKITILVGQNDCGKSNVLRGIEWGSQIYNLHNVGYASEIDFHLRDKEQVPVLHVRHHYNESEQLALQKLGNISLLIPIVTNFDEKISAPPEVQALAYDSLPPLFSALELNRDTYPPDIEASVKKQLSVKLAYNVIKQLPKVQIIPQFRRIEDTEKYSIEGKGIVRLLSLWQHPEIGKDQNRHRFERVQKLLRDLLERPNVTLEVPHTHKEILVHDTKTGLRLPLESHGTGIHQLIILAIAVLSEDDALYGIEEPEIHLHPVLQKRFLKFLREETTGRYIITTHSPVLIAPAEDVDVIHLKMVDGVTIPRRIETDAGSLEALEDLGIRPSDLLQANSVVWVEGPSDRTYIKRWLELLAPDLAEGIDYSMMFYGGRLLSHLSLEREVDPGVEPLVKLLRINQRSAIVMDSDRKKSVNDPLNATKQRIIEEGKANGLHCWVTHGREIENYLTARTVEAAVQELRPLQDSFALAITGMFGGSFKRAVGEDAPAKFDYDSHKPFWAHRFAMHIEEADITHGLKESVVQLANFIRRRTQSATEA